MSSLSIDECLLYSELTKGDEVDKTNSLSMDECLLYSELTEGRMK